MTSSLGCARVHGVSLAQAQVNGDGSAGAVAAVLTGPGAPTSVSAERTSAVAVVMSGQA
jgi:hypothetical protein